MGLDAAVRRIVTERDGWRCALCGKRTDQIHHRRPRQMGGTRTDWVNLPANLVLLCGSGTQGCHGWVEHYRKRSIELGLLISQHSAERASEVPVRYGQDDWRLLDDEGGWQTAKTPV